MITSTLPLVLHGGAQASDQAADEVLGAAKSRIRPIDRGGVDFDQDFVVLRYRPLDLLEPQNFRGPVPVVDDRSHMVPVAPGRHLHKTSYEPATQLPDR
jgi:hypothetical protein